MNFQFTKEELKQISSFSSITELSNLITNKTDNEFRLVPSKMVQDINERLLDNIFCINKLNEYLFNNWNELIKANQDITNKWQYELKSFVKNE
jgi:hypothetical protein